MSDAPLFKDADAQEATYAASEGAENGDTSANQDVDLPVVGMAPSGMATSTTPAGPPGVLPPAVADLDDADDDPERLANT